jgi:hypothetical protein
MRRLWRDYNLSIVLTILFLGCWALQTYTGWKEFAAEQKSRGETPQWLGDSGYVYAWGKTTMENWQSEFLQLLTFVVLTSFLIHKGSHESKDTDEEMMAMLQRIEARLTDLEGRERAQSSQRKAV